MTDCIEWAEIEAECGDYRAGFIAVFRKYEGRLTDEQDAQGRTVKVTATSFARHVGIAEATFRDWRKQERGHRASAPTKRDQLHAKIALRDPERRRELIDSLDAREIEQLAQDATEVAVDRARAKRAERDTNPTADDLMGGERFDPAEYWADTLVIRVNRNARELAGLMKRAGGLLFGTMPPDEAFDYLHEAERLIAEARAAAQEQVRDGVEV